MDLQELLAAPELVQAAGMTVLVVTLLIVTVAVVTGEVTGGFGIGTIGAFIGLVLVSLGSAKEKELRDRDDRATAAHLVKRVTRAERSIEAKRGQFAATSTDFSILAPGTARSLDRGDATLNFSPGKISGAVRVTVRLRNASASELLRPRRPTVNP